MSGQSAGKAMYSRQPEPEMSLREVSPSLLRKLVQLHKALRESTGANEEWICRDALEIIDQMQDRTRGFPPGGARTR